MALSDYDKKYLDRWQKQAIATYTAQYERAVREGDQKAAQMAHEGAEAIRRRAGYSGGATGDGYSKVSETASKPTATSSNERETSKNTGILTRIGQGAVAGLAQAGAMLAGKAGTLMDVRGGTEMTPVYKDQTEMLDRQIAALQNQLRDVSLTARERKEATEALRTAQERKSVYAKAVAANEGTAKKLYETADTARNYARRQKEQSVDGTSGLKRKVLSGIPAATQGAAVAALNTVTPGFGTAAAVLADAGANETRYRDESGADYDPREASVRGVKTIGKDVSVLLGAELLKDYINDIQRLYAERVGGSVNAATEPRLLPSGEQQPPQSAYADALARLEKTNGTDLTKPVTAYDAPPSVIELPETLQPSVASAPASEAKISVADIYKEAYDAIKEVPAKRYPTPKKWGTFPTYDKSFSEANELATRWAHREDIESGAQKAVSYHGKWYLVEKFDSADLGYQIVDRLTDEEYKDFVEEYRAYDKNTSGKGKPLSDSTSGIGSLN